MPGNIAILQRGQHRGGANRVGQRSRVHQIDDRGAELTRRHLLVDRARTGLNRGNLGGLQRDRRILPIPEASDIEFFGSVRPAEYGLGKGAACPQRHDIDLGFACLRVDMIRQPCSP